ncbi:CAP domain-containing protein [Rugosimonospora acidiphila]|uniref:CAP domain-containing protein n=1 Tax=Rugosimonospora acidiphila TaxID=556531 RepID=UPI0031E85B46
MTQPRETPPTAGGGPIGTRRAGHHRTGWRDRIGWRRPGPLGLAAIASGALCVLGLAFALIPPLTSHPHADALPISSDAPNLPAAPPDAFPSASPSPSLPAPQPSTVAVPTVNPASLESELIKLTNQARTKAGCHTVKTDSHLRSAARGHSADMAAKGFLSHAGSDKSTFADRIRKAGYRHPLSENIGKGYVTAQQAITAWLANKGEAANIRNCHAKAVGVGVAVATNGIGYWTEDFGD